LQGFKKYIFDNVVSLKKIGVEMPRNTQKVGRRGFYVFLSVVGLGGGVTIHADIS